MKSYLLSFGCALFLLGLFALGLAWISPHAPVRETGEREDIIFISFGAGLLAVACLALLVALIWEHAL